MKNRIDTKKIMVGNVQIGGNNHIVIQSMCNTKTKDIEATVICFLIPYHLLHVQHVEGQW